MVSSPLAKLRALVRAATDSPQTIGQRTTGMAAGSDFLSQSAATARSVGARGSTESSLTVWSVAPTALRGHGARSTSLRAGPRPHEFRLRDQSKAAVEEDALLA